jgi:hypothetical protein
VNLFLTPRCDQGCAFCYARAWMERSAHAGLEAMLPALEHYAGLVARAPEPAPWQAGQWDAALLAHSAGVVNLLGGEPTAHPDFEALVRRLRALQLGVHLFTSGAHPERVRAVADQLWFVTLNGHFAARAPALGIEPVRLCANLPLRPGDDIEALLGGVAEAGIPSVVLAFAAPGGSAAGPFFSLEDRPAMVTAHQRAVSAASSLGLAVGWDCAPPRCVVPEAGPRCLPVPVLDPEGRVSICGGAYLLARARRPLDSFESLAALHRWALEVHGALERRPPTWSVCRGCPERERGCMGQCLAWREL